MLGCNEMSGKQCKKVQGVKVKDLYVYLVHFTRKIVMQYLVSAVLGQRLQLTRNCETWINWSGILYDEAWISLCGEDRRLRRALCKCKQCLEAIEYPMVAMFNLFAWISVFLYKSLSKYRNVVAL